ncbi:MAG: type II toxin-antitoxin system HicB family antitoxin [Syntrophomonadaceae bacterium]|nr:type II toxin-antitoxin system HicB family antitoxin [Syntrophomonadaceae bacterium]MDD4562540.1 type II toxin-antitoxin system HicB family antitoxin [Syntrophomonadaceae bacterium]
MKYKVVLFKDEDNYIVASCPALPGCASQGKTREEALANIKEAIYGCIEARKEMGLPLGNEEEIVEVEVAI